MALTEISRFGQRVFSEVLTLPSRTSRAPFFGAVTTLTSAGAPSLQSFFRFETTPSRVTLPATASALRKTCEVWAEASEARQQSAVPEIAAARGARGDVIGSLRLRRARSRTRLRPRSSRTSTGKRRGRIPAAPPGRALGRGTWRDDGAR